MPWKVGGDLRFRASIFGAETILKVNFCNLSLFSGFLDLVSAKKNSERRGGKKGPETHPLKKDGLPDCAFIFCKTSARFDSCDAKSLAIAIV